MFYILLAHYQRQRDFFKNNLVEVEKHIWIKSPGRLNTNEPMRVHHQILGVNSKDTLNKLK